MTQIVGVLNLTPDSFSDGGQFTNPNRAVNHAHKMGTAGADIIDIGGESTRPWATPTHPVEELRRVEPIIRAVARTHTVSIDTMHTSTARAAVKAGASIVNDVTGGTADPAMFDLIAETGTQYILGHWAYNTDNSIAHRPDVADVNRVVDDLAARADDALRTGVARLQIVLDPGLGFGKSAELCWSLLNRLPAVLSLGFPVMVGASRKRFISGLVRQGSEPDLDLATAVVSVLAAQQGVWAVRVHDVRATALALLVAGRWRAG